MPAPTPLPANVGFGTITGRFIVAEQVDLSATDPDATPAKGTVTFTPSVASLRNVTASPKAIVVPKPIVVGLDSNGALEARLIATDDPDLNPVGWTYTVSFAFTNVANPPNYSISVPVGSTQDLADLAPVAQSRGTFYVVPPIAEEAIANSEAAAADAEAAATAAASSASSASSSATSAAASAALVGAPAGSAINAFLGTADSYGAVGNGIADDTSALNTFLAARAGQLSPSNGTYKATGNLPNLHAVRHTGSGRIVRDGITFYLNPTGTQTNTIYVSPTGSDTNDGITPALPKLTVQAAFDVLKAYGPMLDGFWQVVLAAGTYAVAGNEAILETPSRNRVVVRGPAVGGSPAVPTAILDGAGGAAYTHGIRIIGTGVLAEIRDIKAINFTTGVGDNSRIGFSGENDADLLTNNCHVTGASWCGIYGFSVARLRVYGGILDGCRSGAIANDSPATIGGSASTNVVYVRNSTESGIYWSRGSQGHIDYVTFEDNSVALLVAENSRVDTVANTFKRNSYDIRTQTGGVWGEGGALNIYGTGADASPNGNNDFAFSGNNAELATSTSWKRVAVDRTTRSLTGTTSATVMTTPYTIKARRMVGAGKSCRVNAVGVFTAATAGTVVTVSFGGMSLALTIPAAATNLTFEIDVTLYEVQGGYRAVGKIAQGLSAQRYGTTTSGFTSTADQAVTISATPANAADTITIYRTDVYLMG